MLFLKTLLMFVFLIVCIDRSYAGKEISSIFEFGKCIGHITICDDVHIHGMSMITKSITSKGEYASAMAADTVRNWRKNQVLFRNLYKKNR